MILENQTSKRFFKTVFICYFLEIFSSFLKLFLSICIIADTRDERLYGSFHAVRIRVNRSWSRASQKRDEYFDQEFTGCM